MQKWPCRTSTLHTITPELWPFAKQHTITMFNTTKCRSHEYEESPWEQSTGDISKLYQSNMHPLFCPVFVLDRCLQEGISHPKWTK
jgi:hypothetical protein